MSEPTIVFHNAALFDGKADELVPDSYVIVRGREIEEVGHGLPKINSDCIRFDLAGRTLMPGLIDCHVHVYAYRADLSASDDSAPTMRALYARKFMENALDRGFTTLRDAGGADCHLAQAIGAGLIRSPRLFYCGKALSQTGGHGDFRRPQRFQPCACEYCGAISILADGVDEVRKVAREQLRMGAHHLKIMASGGTASPSDAVWMQQYSDAEITAVVEEAKRRRTYVMAHAYTDEAIRRCVDLGARSIEHGNFVSSETAARMRDVGAFLVPTLVTYEAMSRYGPRIGIPEESMRKIADVRNTGIDSLEICHKAGTKMGFGTDLLGELEEFQCDEFRIRSEALPAREILRSATTINAELVGMADRLGVIARGALADLIVVDGNPLENVTVFKNDGSNVRLVMTDGRVVKNSL